MADTKYRFAIAGMRCLSEEEHADRVNQDSYFQCMCDSGITSYCSRVTGWSTTPPQEPDSNRTANETSPWDDLNDLFEEIHKDSHQPELTYDVPDKSRTHLDIGVFLLLLLLVLICVVYAIYHCTCGARRTEGGEPPQRESTRRRRRSSARSGGAAAAASTVNDVTSGGGGGGGQGETAAPVDLPPPYDLVYEENITPPTYEEVIREEAKDGARDPV
ncbi:uncharacterized protein LOC122374551 [Amphibalanus amphitrite]|uniref:uncharacterized protein LOC122374551 n=1 Tax=Amphibalanus amphitrite TaxID=1232801 RepID=UPI001C8FE282|nr:uncharacterized protein LOC122374551 [Amphibalanus amphitrite]